MQYAPTRDAAGLAGSVDRERRHCPCVACFRYLRYSASVVGISKHSIVREDAPTVTSLENPKRSVGIFAVIEMHADRNARPEQASATLKFRIDRAASSYVLMSGYEPVSGGRLLE